MGSGVGFMFEDFCNPNRASGTMVIHKSSSQGLGSFTNIFAHMVRMTTYNSEHWCYQYSDAVDTIGPELRGREFQNLFNRGETWVSEMNMLGVGCALRGNYSHTLQEYVARYYWGPQFIERPQKFFPN